VNIFGQPYKLRARIEIMDSFSGHADNSELIDYFKATTGNKKKVWLIHGEQTRSEIFREELQAIHDGDVEVGVLGKEIRF
jgi:metallo-beta-lactamase family protein